MTETKTATKTVNTSPTCTSTGKYDYRIASWSNSSVFSSRSCPDWHTPSALGHSYTKSYDYGGISGLVQHTITYTCSRCSDSYTEKEGHNPWNGKALCVCGFQLLPLTDSIM